MGTQNCLYQLMFSGCLLLDATPACKYATVGYCTGAKCITMMMLMRADNDDDDDDDTLVLLTMLLVIAVDGTYDQNCHGNDNSHQFGHSICHGHCAGICTWPAVAAWRHKASGGSGL